MPGSGAPSASAAVDGCAGAGEGVAAHAAVAAVAESIESAAAVKLVAAVASECPADASQAA